MLTVVTRIRLFGAAIFVTCAIGCFGVETPKRPPFDPVASAASAMTKYDTNSDGAIDEKEVAAAPGLKAAWKHIDKDDDKSITTQELEARITYYKTAPTAIVQGMVQVNYKNRPLSGATVTFEPEDFLGEAFIPCTGTTNEDGYASIKGHDPNFPGIYLGFYRVRISREKNGKEEIPAKYNTETTIGYEAQEDDNAGQVGDIVLNLK